MKAVIFDLDGTLLDVREGFYWQLQELSQLYDGAPVSRKMIDSVAHGTTEQIVRSVVSNTKVPFEDICRTHEQLRLVSYDRHLALYEGVDELLPILKRMGVGIAAFTSGNHHTIACLKRLNIDHLFDSIVDASHVSNPKPHPEGLHLALQQLQAEPHEAAMVGDSVVDILAGRNAGVHKTIGITHGFGKIEALHAAGADHVVHDIASILDVLE